MIWCNTLRCCCCYCYCSKRMRWKRAGILFYTSAHSKYGTDLSCWYSGLIYPTVTTHVRNLPKTFVIKMPFITPVYVPIFIAPQLEKQFFCRGEASKRKSSSCVIKARHPMGQRPAHQLTCCLQKPWKMLVIVSHPHNGIFFAIVWVQKKDFLENCNFTCR